MLLLLFEVTPREGHVDEYLDIAATLRPALDAMGGCLFLDRYRSLAQPRKLLSFQVWRDEASMTRWRVDGHHHTAQTLGRTRVFDDYRLRVAEIIRGEAVGEAPWQPARRCSWHDPAVTAPRYVAIAESLGATVAGASESFESIYRPGEYAHLLAFATEQSAPTLETLPGARRVRVAEIERDYGMFERGEAPQYYPPIPSSATRPAS